MWDGFARAVAMTRDGERGLYFIDITMIPLFGDKPGRTAVVSVSDN
jgi:hypothetical protein